MVNMRLKVYCHLFARLRVIWIIRSIPGMDFEVLLVPERMPRDIADMRMSVKERSDAVKLSLEMCLANRDIDHTSE